MHYYGDKTRQMMCAVFYSEALCCGTMSLKKGRATIDLKAVVFTSVVRNPTMFLGHFKYCNSKCLSKM